VTSTWERSFAGAAPLAREIAIDVVDMNACIQRCSKGTNAREVLMRAALVLMILCVACNGASPGPDGGGFETTLLGKERAANALSATEAARLCDEGVAYVNGLLTPDQWERAVCYGSEAQGAASPAACEQALSQCIADGSWTGFDWTYERRCGVARSTMCTVSVQELEACWTEIGTSVRATLLNTDCSRANGMTMSRQLTLSPGCQVVYGDDFDTGPCGCLLGRSGTDCNP
jgi:hypothetical protein